MKDRGLKPQPKVRAAGPLSIDSIGDGPGTELLGIFKSDPIGKHATSCPACLQLAQQMNQWGPAGCRERMDEIVEDILPRAKDWIIAAADGGIQGLDLGALDRSKLSIASAWKFKGDEPTPVEKMKAATADQTMRVWISRQVKKAIRQAERKEADLKKKEANPQQAAPSQAGFPQA